MKDYKNVLNKAEFDKVYSLYSRQPWLMDREISFLELLILCKTAEQKNLIFELLNDFHFLEGNVLNRYLNFIADFIITDSGFIENKTQVASITYDDEADSSQKLVDYIKMPLYRQGWKDIKTVNRFGAIMRNFKEGKKQILLIDEFVGSGKTILGRIKQLQNDIKEEFELKFCFIAGMEIGLKKIEALGYEVYCPLRLSRGISDKYKGLDLTKNTKTMISLEEKLARTINNFDISDYSFGFGQAEALYTLEGKEGNTPNSVFPIFWWPQKKNGKKRNTLLTRYEKGLK